MNRTFAILARVLTLLFVLHSLVGCGGTSAVSPDDVYHYMSKSGSMPSKDLQLESNTKGGYDLTGLTGNAKFAGEINLNTGDISYYFDGPGSTNIKVVIGKDVGRTDYGGLNWRDEVVLNIWTDGIIEVDREGVEAPDSSGTKWISKRVRINDKDAIVMVRLH